MRRADTAGRVVAIGVDAAEPTLLRRLLAEGAMPSLAALLERGRWSRVDSPTSVGSGSVWPTFLTGSPPAVHGIYSEWLWDPDAMTLRPCDTSALTPFWSRIAAGGLRVGVLDVPFAPFVGVEEGFEVSEWGAHDVLEGRTRAAPPSIAALVDGEQQHPFAADGVAHTADNVAAAALRGIALRGALAERLLSDVDPHLALVVFTEIHHASHLLWHTVAPDDPLVKGSELGAPPSGPTLTELYRAVDREIGRLVEVAGADASIVVFGLHGMRATRGIPTRLPRLLHDDGHAQPATWRTQSWKERSLTAFGALKRASPAWARQLYNAKVAHAVRVNLAQPTMLDPLDWSRTRAFSLPTDQHGWVRVNLRGRERRGVVDRRDFDSLCDALEARLRGLVTSDGLAVVANVVRMVRGEGEAAGNPLPDLVAHWSPAAFDDPSQLSTLRLTGQHSDEGFCVAAGPVAAGLGDVVKAESLHAALLGPLTA